MQLSFKMLMISLVLFLSDVCVHLNAASNGVRGAMEQPTDLRSARSS